MKKTLQIVGALALAALLILGGCANPLSDESWKDKSGDEGTVLLQLDDPSAARTLVPANVDFDRYEVYASLAGSSTVKQESLTSVPTALNLAPGTWTIEVTGYVGDKALARGIARDTTSLAASSITVQAGKSIAARVILLPIQDQDAAQGTFSYKVDFGDIALDELDGADTTLNLYYQGSETSVATVHLTEKVDATAKTRSGTVDLIPGWYTLKLRVVSTRTLDGEPLGIYRTEVVYIYPDLSTAYEPDAFSEGQLSAFVHFSGTAKITSDTTPGPRTYQPSAVYVTYADEPDSIDLAKVNAGTLVYDPTAKIAQWELSIPSKELNDTLSRRENKLYFRFKAIENNNVLYSAWENAGIGDINGKEGIELTAAIRPVASAQPFFGTIKIGQRDDKGKFVENTAGDAAAGARIDVLVSPARAPAAIAGYGVYGSPIVTVAGADNPIAHFVSSDAEGVYYYFDFPASATKVIKLEANSYAIKGTSLPAKGEGNYTVSKIRIIDTTETEKEKDIASIDTFAANGDWSIPVPLAYQYSDDNTTVRYEITWKSSETGAPEIITRGPEDTGTLASIQGFSAETTVYSIPDWTSTSGTVKISPEKYAATGSTVELVLKPATNWGIDPDDISINGYPLGSDRGPQFNAADADGSLHVSYTLTDGISIYPGFYQYRGRALPAVGSAGNFKATAIRLIDTTNGRSEKPIATVTVNNIDPNGNWSAPVPDAYQLSLIETTRWEIDWQSSDGTTITTKADTERNKIVEYKRLDQRPLIHSLSTVGFSTGGAIELTPSKYALKGSIVNVTVKPDSGYGFDPNSLKLDGAADLSQRWSDTPGTYYYTFKVVGNVANPRASFYHLDGTVRFSTTGISAWTNATITAIDISSGNVIGTSSRVNISSSVAASWSISVPDAYKIVDQDNPVGFKVTVTKANGTDPREYDYIVNDADRFGKVPYSQLANQQILTLPSPDSDSAGTVPQIISISGSLSPKTITIEINGDSSYNVYRSDSKSSGKTLLNATPVPKGQPYPDNQGLVFDQEYTYTVTALGKYTDSNGKYVEGTTSSDPESITLIPLPFPGRGNISSGELKPNEPNVYRLTVPAGEWYQITLFDRNAPGYYGGSVNATATGTWDDVDRKPIFTNNGGDVYVSNDAREERVLYVTVSAASSGESGSYYIGYNQDSQPLSTGGDNGYWNQNRTTTYYYRISANTNASIQFQDIWEDGWYTLSWDSPDGEPITTLDDGYQDVSNYSDTPRYLYVQARAYSGNSSGQFRYYFNQY